jgi:hypothetical protein
MLRSLQRCEGFAESKIIVLADGPKDSEDRDAVNAVRRVAQELLGLRAEYHFSDVHRGLAASIIHGVGSVTERFGRAIIVEDDLDLAPNFLTYLNAGLDKYAEKPEVFQIAGHMFDTAEFRARDSALFLPFTTTWGWATWRRAWEQFDPLAEGWQSLKSDQTLRRRFNLNGAYDYSNMLEQQMAGSRDSWGVRWYWSVFSRDGLVCFPPTSLVRNTGTDGSGTHGRGVLRRFRGSTGSTDGKLIAFPDDALVNPEDFAAVRRAIWRQNGGWLGASTDRLRQRFQQFPRRLR